MSSVAAASAVACGHARAASRVMLVLVVLLAWCFTPQQVQGLAHSSSSGSNSGSSKLVPTYFRRHLAQSSGTCSRACSRYLENDCVKWMCSCGQAGTGTYSITALLVGCDFSSVDWACCMQGDGQECVTAPSDCSSAAGAFAVSPHNGRCYCAGVDFQMTFTAAMGAGSATFYLADAANRGNVPWQMGGSSSSSGVCGGEDPGSGGCDPSNVCKVTKTFQELSCPATCPGARPSCRSINPTAADPQPFACLRGVFNPGSRDTAPSQANCCQETCLDSDLSSPIPVRFGCEPGTVFNPAMQHKTQPSQQNCCLQTCLRPTAGSTEQFDCKGGAFSREAGSSTDVSARTCCVPVCQSIDVEKPDRQFKCSPGWRSNPLAANNQPPSDVACCLRSASPSETADVALDLSGPDAPQLVGDSFTATVAVEVLDGQNGAQTSLEVTLPDALRLAGSLPPGCMQPTDPQKITCIGLGTQALGTQRRLSIRLAGTKAGTFKIRAELMIDDSNPDNNKATAAVTVLGACCDAFSRTCTHAASDTDCAGVFSATKDCGSAPDCWATCSSTDPVRAPGQPFRCNPGTVFNRASADRFPPSHGLCCLPTCANPDASRTTPQPFDCPMMLRWRLDPSKLNALNPSVCTCCKKMPLDPPDVSFTLKPLNVQREDGLYEVAVKDAVNFELNATADIGLDDVDGVTVKVFLAPSGRGRLNTNAEGCKVDATQQQMSCTPFTLPLLQTRSIRFAVRPEVAGRLVVKASVAADFDPDPTNDNRQLALAVRGACCSPTFDTCRNVDERACSKASGVFSSSKPCSEVTCSTPVRGSCCVPAIGQCSNRLKAACDKVAGAVFTPGADCSDSPCGVARGSCCSVKTGVCTVRARNSCTKLASNKWSSSESCGDAFCPSPAKAGGSQPPALMGDRTKP